MIAFSLTLVLTVLALLLAWITYYGQSRGTDKRLIYASSLQPINMEHQGIAPRSSLYQVSIFYDDLPLFFPQSFLFRLENTGRSAILAGDFDGPISIDLGRKAQILYGVIEFSRGSRQHWRERLRAEGGCIYIDPSLLNSGDSFTFTLLVEGVAHEPEVSLRIAGVEEPIEAGSHSGGARVGVEFLNMTREPSETAKLLNTYFLSRPLILLPWDDNFDYEGLLKVEVDDERIASPHEITFTIHDLDRFLDTREEQYFIEVSWSRTRILRHWVTVDDESVDEPSHLVDVSDSRLAVKGAAARAGEELRVIMLCAGDGSDWTGDVIHEDMSFGRMHTDDFLTNNLPKITSKDVLVADEITKSGVLAYELLRHSFKAVSRSIDSIITRNFKKHDGP